MNVLALGQEPIWLRELSGLCKKDKIYICEQDHRLRNIQLVITDFPIEAARKGAFTRIPFLVVSREKREEKILEAFDKGAEDYMVYPVSPRIAKARILRIIENYEMATKRDPVMELGIHFTPNEYRILSYMMSYPGRVFSRSQLLEGVFPEVYQGYDRNVDNYIKQIRKKLAAVCHEGAQIETVYGVGYRYVKQENEEISRKCRQ